MKYLLIGGAESVGKTGAIIRLTDLLMSKGFSITSGVYPSANGEVRIILEGLDSKKRNIRILINSATDTPKIIRGLKQFMDANQGYDLLISSIRDEGSWPRDNFFSITGISKTAKQLTEIPLAKITRQNAKFPIALNWYVERMDKLIGMVVTSPPYNLW